MPPQLLFDISGVDLNRVLFDQEHIRTINPQRGPMEQLDAIVYVDEPNSCIVGYKDVKTDEFWVEGHIPGRPLLPGVLMIEAAAQLAGFYTAKYIGWKGFIGFGGAGETRFRQMVEPGCRLYLLAKQQWHRHRRVSCEVQGIINGALVFETTIVGTQL